MKGKWKVRRSIWPYKEGYGLVNDKTNCILDTGLSYDQVVAKAAQLNKKEANK